MVSTHPNSILRHLSAADLKLFEGMLTPVSFVHGETLAEIGLPIERVFFPNSGMISVVVPLASGEAIEAGVIGRADVFGAGAAFGAKHHINNAVCQMPGSFSVIKAADLANAAAQSETLRRELFKREQFLLAQAQQSAACNARHDIPQRLATWLLRVHDRAQQEELALTQEFLGQMLGVQRASVSIAAAALQDAGIIQYRRGSIRILDQKRLEASACECFDALRMQFERMFPADHAVLERARVMDDAGKPIAAV
jgi:CRP-like cAMP-binding protein